MKDLPKKAVWTLLIALLILFWGSYSKTLTFYFYSVGQGDSIRINTPYSVGILVDGGPGYTIDGYLSQSDFILCGIDLVVLTHPHADHLEGLERYVRRCSPVVITTTYSTTYTSKTNSMWNARINEFEVVEVVAGDVLMVGDILLEVLWPAPIEEGFFEKNINNASIVLLLKYKNFSALLTGDIEQDVMRLLAEEYSQKIPGRIDLIKVPHHGSDTGLYKKFFAFGPSIGVVQVGENNSHGHPSRLLLEELSNNDIRVFRTDKDGTIEVKVR